MQIIVCDNGAKTAKKSYSLEIFHFFLVYLFISEQSKSVFVSFVGCLLSELLIFFINSITCQLVIDISGFCLISRFAWITCATAAK